MGGGGWGVEFLCLWHLGNDAWGLRAYFAIPIFINGVRFIGKTQNNEEAMPMSVDEMRVTRFKRRVYFEECLEQVVLEYYKRPQTATNGRVPQDIPPLTVPRPIAGLLESED